jgi:phosphohistidine swiveling domain-containing protein
MSRQNPTPKKLDWKLMYEGPDIGHLLAYQVFIQPFLAEGSLLNDITGFTYDYYLWYTDSKEAGGLHGASYVVSDLERATKRGEKIFFDQTWLKKWYADIDTDAGKVTRVMKKHAFEKNIEKISTTKILKLLPEIIELKYRLVTLLRCSQPQFTDALKNRLFAILKQTISNDHEVEQVFVTLTLPEDKSLFTEEELAWLDIVITAKDVIHSKDIQRISEELLEQKYKNVFRLLKDHHELYQLIPASDRTPAWDLKHFIELLKTNIHSHIDHAEKKRHIAEQYTSAIETKRDLIKKYKLPKEALLIGSRIAKVGFYRFKAAFYWRWMGYYMVLVCKKYAKKCGLTYKEMSSLTKEELPGALQGKMVISKEELHRRADVELYLHYEGKDYIWWGEEARQKKAEILGAVDYSTMTELKGEVGNTGLVKGIAYVFHWSDDVSKKVHLMPKDSVLVAPQTHPTYMPAIRLAKALVCDEGGVTGHAAIVSRELRKPCVIGLHIATKAINTGDEIEVDANRGVVRILKRAKRHAKKK